MTKLVTPGPGVILSAAKDLLLLSTLAAFSACTGAGDSSNAAVTPAGTYVAPASFDVGSAIDSVQLKLVDIDAGPSGTTLPAGSGNATKGLLVYASKCASCHGAKGEGIANAPKLVGRDPREGFPFGRDVKLVKTVGNYWPYATTVYDYVHRAMPLTAPGSLTPDEVYSVVAWILAENEIIPRDAELNAKTLAAVKMPAAGRFVVDDRKGKTIR